MTPSIDWLIALVNLVLCIVLAEAAWLACTRRGPLLATALSGLGLLLALRLAVGAAGWPWVAMALAAAGLAHVIDLHARWHAPPEPALEPSAGALLQPSPKGVPR